MSSIVQHITKDLERRRKRNFGDLSAPHYFHALCATLGRSRADLLREIAEAVDRGELAVETIQFRAVEK